MMMSYKIFRYSPTSSKILLTVALICSFIHGALFPLILITFGDRINAFVGDGSNTEGSATAFVEYVSSSKLFLIGITIAFFFCSFFESSLSSIAARNITTSIQSHLFDSLLRQTASFYQSNLPDSLTHAMVSDINLIRTGVGDKLAMAMQMIGMFVCAVAIGIVRAWRYTLIFCIATPVLLFATISSERYAARAAQESSNAESLATETAAEPLSMMISVKSFCGEQTEIERYRESLSRGYHSKIRAVLISVGR